MKNRIIILGVSLLFMVTGVNAETHEAHEHGAVEAQIELNDTQGHIQFTLTGMDFLGFGYLPESSEDLELLEKTVDSVINSQLVEIKTGWFGKAEIKHIEVGDGHGEFHDDEDHEDGDHHEDGENEEDHHDDKDHHEDGDHHEDHDGHSEHSEYSITVELEYSSFSKLKSFDISNFFTIFPSVEDVDWIVISDDGQSAGEASVKNPVIKVN